MRWLTNLGETLIGAVGVGIMYLVGSLVAGLQILFAVGIALFALRLVGCH